MLKYKKINYHSLKNTKCPECPEASPATAIVTFDFDKWFHHMVHIPIINRQLLSYYLVLAFAREGQCLEVELKSFDILMCVNSFLFRSWFTDVFPGLNDAQLHICVTLRKYLFLLFSWHCLIIILENRWIAIDCQWRLHGACTKIITFKHISSGIADPW